MSENLGKQIEVVLLVGIANRSRQFKTPCTISPQPVLTQDLVDPHLKDQRKVSLPAI